MENITITIFVEPNSLLSLMQVLKIIDSIDIEQSYTFQPLDIKYSEAMISNWLFTNLSIELFIKFKYYWKLSGGK
jgi:hypothetical protein